MHNMNGGPNIRRALLFPPIMLWENHWIRFFFFFQWNIKKDIEVSIVCGETNSVYLCLAVSRSTTLVSSDYERLF